MQDITKKKAEYRSSIRSKALIRSAMLELLKEKDFFDISVTDIVNKANINRGTFYAHFQDTYDVIDQILDGELTMIADEIEKFSTEEILNNSMAVFGKLSDEILNRNNYIKLILSIGRSTKCSRKLIARIVSILMRICPEGISESARETFRIKMSFLADGLFAVYFDTLKGTFNVDIPSVAIIIGPMVQVCVKEALEAAVAEKV